MGFYHKINIFCSFNVICFESTYYFDPHSRLGVLPDRSEGGVWAGPGPWPGAKYIPWTLLLSTHCIKGFTFLGSEWGGVVADTGQPAAAAAAPTSILMVLWKLLNSMHQAPA